ncbi:MAG: autotransporter outer membrane beta-barrel domain-containing protein [Anaerovibrio sp.]
MAHYADVSRLYLYLSGGVLDFYHKAPGIPGDRSNNVTIKNYTGGDLNNTTFRVKSDIINNKTTQIIFNDSSITSDETYYLQVAYDPSLSATEILQAANTNQTVFDLSGLELNGNTATVTAKEYSQPSDGGLNILKIKPNIAFDANTNTYYITSLVPNNVTTSSGSGSSEGTGSSGSSSSEGTGSIIISDGPAMQMAKSAGIASQAMLSAARADNNDLMRRMGDLRNSEGEAGAWVRYYTGESDVKVGNKTKVRYNAVQGGYDKKFDLKDGKLFAGIAVSHTDSDFSFSEGGGDADTTLFGVYGSYVGNKGHFADLIFKYGRMGSDFATYSGGNHYGGSSSANMMSLAAEYGYRLKLKGNWYMEPQAELTYGYVGGDDYTMTMNGGPGAHVSTDASKSFIGRFGITLGRKVDTSSFYAKLSLCREFAGNMDMTAIYGTTVKPYHESLKDTWVEYGLGFNTKVGPDVNLYGELEKSTGSAIENKWRANIGLRYAF